jgi:hypothetical protein
VLAASAPTASAQAVFNTDVPAGKWRALRVRAVPEGAVLAVQITLEGTIAVALVRAPEAARRRRASRRGEGPGRGPTRPPAPVKPKKGTEPEA